MPKTVTTTRFTETEIREALAFWFQQQPNRSAHEIDPTDIEFLDDADQPIQFEITASVHY